MKDINNVIGRQVKGVSFYEANAPGNYDQVILVFENDAMLVLDVVGEPYFIDERHGAAEETND